MAVSIRSIAEDLGLSKATVSWILSGKGKERGFSASRIEEVKRYAEKVGYRPNLIAGSLSKGYTRTIALVIPSISDPFYSRMAQGVEAKASESGYVMILGTSEGNDGKERQLIRTLRSQQVAGLIVAPTNRSDSTISAMLDEGFPFVLIDRYIPDLCSNYVIFDNEESSYDMVSHLCRSGCRNIAFVTTDTHLSTMRMRFDGYRRALSDYRMGEGLFPVVEIRRSSYEDDIVIKLDSLLPGLADIDSFFFTTHYLAEEAIRYFVSRGIDYNRRFRMASVHSTKALEILAPEMSRTVIPIEEMGRIATDVLLKNVLSSGDFVPERLVLKSIRYML